MTEEELSKRYEQREHYMACEKAMTDCSQCLDYQNWNNTRNSCDHYEFYSYVDNCKKLSHDD